jgi:hypothetical protein
MSVEQERAHKKKKLMTSSPKAAHEIDTSSIISNICSN